jgi:hypothetical protein
MILSPQVVCIMERSRSNLVTPEQQVES